MNPEKVKIAELQFKKMIDVADINDKVAELGKKLGEDYGGEVPILLSVLSGSFVFVADLMRSIPIPNEIIFVRAKSYVGLESTGNVQIEQLPEKLTGRDVIIVEDIIDTGHTLDALLKALAPMSPKSVKVASFLKKPEAYGYDHPVDYCCFEIPNDFVIGYGLDYNQHGRGLSSLYVLEESQS